MKENANARWWAMGATALTLLVVGLDMTVLNVALPDIAVALNASNAQLQWFADAYLLVLAAVMLPAGMLGDRFGRKGLTLGALAAFGVGSLWCAYASSPASLIAGRSFLGLGAAVLIPLAMSAVVVLFEPSERPRAVLILGLSTMVGLPLGPIAAGLLLDHFWWGSVFVINAPVIAFALVAVARFMPGGHTRATSDRLDLVGIAGSGLALLGLTYGVIEAPSRGWTDPVVLVAAIGGLVVLAGFLIWERRLVGAVPVFDFEIWANRSFRWGGISAAVASLAFFGLMFTVPQYFRAVLGADALGTGLRTLPMVGGLLVSMRLANLLTSRVPGRVLAAVGFLVIAVGLALGATTDVSDGFARSALWTTITGAGFGVALFSAQNTALMNLPRARAATGSALIQTLRQVGSVLGIAVLGAVLNDRYRSAVDTAGLPAQLAGTVRESAQAGLSVAHATGSPALGHSVAAAFVQGMDRALWMSAGVAVFGAVLVFAFMGAHQSAEAARTGEPRPELAGDAAESEDAAVDESRAGVSADARTP